MLISCSDVAEAIIKSKKWKVALNNYTCTQDGEITSPFRKLIQRMPGSDRRERHVAIVMHGELFRSCQNILVVMQDTL